LSELNPLGTSKNYAHIVVLCTTIPAAIAILLVLSALCFVSYKKKKKMDVAELERRRTLARGALEMQSLGKGETWDK
jgi:hypothetical protein